MATPGRSTRGSSVGWSRTMFYFSLCHYYRYGNHRSHYQVVQAFCPSLQQRRWMNQYINIMNHPHLPPGRPRWQPPYPPSTRHTTYSTSKLDHDHDKKNNRSIINDKAFLFPNKSDREFGALVMASFFHQAAVPLADLVNGALLYSKLQDPVVLGAVGVARASQVRCDVSCGTFPTVPCLTIQV
jgi:hypothetical protein